MSSYPHDPSALSTGEIQQKYNTFAPWYDWVEGLPECLGIRRLRRHLAATIQNDEAVVSSGEVQFFSARQAYHLFHTCHQYAAYSLREAGLPLSPFWAFNRMAFAWQLRRAVRLAEAQSTAALPSDL